MPKRGRSGSRVRANYARVTSVSQMGRARAARASYKKKKTLASQVRALTRTIETKESQWRTRTDWGMFHNGVYVVEQNGGGGYLNVFKMNQGVYDEDRGSSGGYRIGDEINVKSVMFKFFLETALNRPKVYFRFMLVKCSKGDTPTRDTLFKNNCNNKMIDQINNERFTIVYQRVINITASNPTASLVSATGAPEELDVAGLVNAGMATRILTCHIPGKRFGRGGRIVYENSSTTQVKFYDYIPVFVVYDWYGTPQDVNIVGRINEGYCKIYYKDA